MPLLAISISVSFVWSCNININSASNINTNNDSDSLCLCIEPRHPWLIIEEVLPTFQKTLSNNYFLMKKYCGINNRLYAGQEIQFESLTKSEAKCVVKYSIWKPMKVCLNSRPLNNLDWHSLFHVRCVARNSVQKNKKLS